jgi:hypothetical protein
VLRRFDLLIFALVVLFSLASCGQSGDPDGKIEPLQMAQDIKSGTSVLSLPTSGKTEIRVDVQNTSGYAWPAEGKYPVRLSYKLFKGGLPVGEGPRTPLPASVARGASVTLSQAITAPDSAGDYQILVGMMQEGSWWFTDAGAKGLSIPLTVK